MTNSKIKKIADFLDCPEKIVWAWKQKDWKVVKVYAQNQWNKDGYHLMKRYSGAIERIKDKFCDLKGYEGYSLKGWQKKKIAFYCDALGVGYLVKDMEEMIQENQRIRSINYFLKGDSDQVCRWEEARLERLREKWRKEKKQYQKAMEKAAEKTGVKQELNKSQGKPEWVKNAENRLEELENKPDEDLTITERSEITTLKMRIRNYEEGE